MRMKIRKLTAIEPVNFLPEGRERLKDYCGKVIFYDDPPRDAEEIIERIGDSDGILVSYTNRIGEEILGRCPQLKYIGMCCSLYGESSSNVDIRYAREHGIIVKGIRDYGDEGVGEYVTASLIGRLHGTDGHPPFLGRESEVSGVRVGILGMGASARAVARALSAFGAGISYYSRTRKPELESTCGYRYMELYDLLSNCDVVCSCLSKNVTLLHRKEMELFGDHKILFNTALSPCFDLDGMEAWLAGENTWYFCDTLMALGDERLLAYSNVRCQKKSSGMTMQAAERLNEKVLANIREYLDEVSS